MAYIGNTPAEAYTSFDKQTITGDGGASYTLDHSVANENEIEVFVNNVRQEPSVAYTVSGTALTMTGNVAASDDFYVVFQGKAIQTVVPPDLTVDTAKIKDSAVTTAKTDFYSTGTWTPTVGNGTVSVAEGSYVKIGTAVFFTVIVGNFSDTSTNSAISITMPFTARSGTADDYHFPVMSRYFNLINRNLTGYMSGNSSSMQLYVSGQASQNWFTANHNDLSSSSAYVRVSGWFQTT